MSRSRRHTPIVGFTSAETVADYKRERAKAERAHQRDLLQKAKLDDESATEALEVETEPWNEWACPRDGKQWIGDLKDVKYRKRLMRK